ncbi:endonuclease VII domain-containing protein [Trujillonella endophytica]|uniref:endonuclease VII domain-containing protein n=1 Tax=Trujillonella endophytica TaxID=673521 RepID=UPI00244E88D1|nr:endonuclease VII domain-containing protein [Trujillella endophytica]
MAAFGRNAASRSGINSYCKPCHNARGRRSKEAAGGGRTYHLRRRYGITAADFDAMLAAQGGLCAICASAPAEHVDHDHDTGRVRRLLCFNCNGGLGQLRDDPGVLRAAARYVEHHRDEPEPARTGPSAPPPSPRRSSSPGRPELRARAAGCRTHDVVRARLAVLLAEPGRSAGS